MADSRYVLVCMTASSVDKVGYLQQEISIALTLAAQQPEGSVFLIPVRLEPCRIPDGMSTWQWVDLFEETGYPRLLRAIGARPARSQAPAQRRVRSAEVRPLLRPRPVLRVWDLADGLEVGVDVPTHIHRFSAVTVAEHPRLRPLAVTIDATDPKSGELGTPRVVTATLRSGQLVAAATDGYSIHLWDLMPTGGGVDVARPYPDPLDNLRVADMAAVTGPDGRAILAVAGHHGGLRFWDLNGPTLISEDTSVQLTALAATVAPNGRGYFVGGCDDTGMRVWDALSVIELSHLKIERSTERTNRRMVLDLAVAQIGGQLVAVTARRGDDHLRRWLLGGDESADIPGSDGSVTSLALSTGSERSAVVAAGHDRLLHVVDLESGLPVAGSSMPMPGVIRAISCLQREPAAVVAGDDVFALIRWGPRGEERSRLA